MIPEPPPPAKNLLLSTTKLAPPITKLASYLLTSPAARLVALASAWVLV